MSARPKTRKVYRIDWYDTEASCEWGDGATVPPLVHSVGYITSWPRKNQKVPCFRFAADFAEEGPGSVRTIPAGMVKGKPVHIHTHKIVYRTRKEQGND